MRGHTGKYPGKLHTTPYNFNERNCVRTLTEKPNAVLANGIIRCIYATLDNGIFNSPAKLSNSHLK